MFPKHFGGADHSYVLQLAVDHSHILGLVDMKILIHYVYTSYVGALAISI